jgi:hypothetical protein
MTFVELAALEICSGAGGQAAGLEAAGFDLAAARRLYWMALNSSKLIGRVAARSQEARAKHVASRRRHAVACSEWDESKQPAWLTSEVFSQRVQPLLAKIPTAAIRSRIGVSRWYAGKIRQGYRPHPRHWEALARLARISAEHGLK